MDTLFKNWAGEPIVKTTLLAANGSNRKYYRLIGDTHTCIATVNPDVLENEAFFYFANALRVNGVRVPEVYAVNEEKTAYLQQDLGNRTLFDYLLSKQNAPGDATDEIRQMYCRVLDDLISMQFLGKEGRVNFAQAYPRPRMDRQAFQWDFNYFKYNFLKFTSVPFDEQRLEDDFQLLIDTLLCGDCDYFVFRDFQTRNMMLTEEDDIYYIDFQGARQGSPLYDLASLLYSSRNNLSDDMRAELLEYYLDMFCDKCNDNGMGTSISRDRLKSLYYAYVLARILQTLGAYGYRGLYEHKNYFLKGIPLALSNACSLIDNQRLPVQLPELDKILHQLHKHPDFYTGDDQLCVRVFSFSYKKGVPIDRTGNGGGYVFDCRALPNPGRYEQYLSLTGKSPEVIAFFQEDENKAIIDDFFAHACAMVDIHIRDFMERKFRNMMVNFGCTGGQHRSVYLAEMMGKYLSEKYDIRVIVKHKEQPQLNVPTSTTS